MEKLSDASVVVIGGGVIGLSAAYHLALEGVTDVVLIEQDELGSGSSSKCAGGVRASYTNEANLTLGLRGLEVYSSFHEKFGREIDFKRRGYLYLLTDADRLPVFEAAVELQRRHGIESSLIDPEQAKAHSPMVGTDGLVGAVWSPEDALCAPESVIQGYASAARRLGVRIMQRTAVTDIETTNGAISAVVTSAGVISTPTVVCAAGAWSGLIGDMAGTTIPVEPVRRRTAFTGPIDPPVGSGPMTMDVETAFWFHTEGPGYLFGWNNADEPAAFDLSFDIDGWVEGMLEIAEKRAPELTEYGIASGWSGYYEVTPDHNQIIDRSPDVDGLIIATGFSGHGFQMAPATGEIVRDLYFEKEPGYDITPFSALRFDLGTSTDEAYII